MSPHLCIGDVEELHSSFDEQPCEDESVVAFVVRRELPRTVKLAHFELLRLDDVAYSIESSKPSGLEEDGISLRLRWPRWEWSPMQGVGLEHFSVFACVKRVDVLQ